MLKTGVIIYTNTFKRIINLPKRGIGDSTVAKIIISANENQVSIWDVVSEIGKYIEGRAVVSIDNFANLIKSYVILMGEDKDAHQIAMHIAKTSGLLHELYVDKTVEGMARHENVQELAWV